MTKTTKATLIGAAVAVAGYVLAATVLRGSGYEQEVIVLLGYAGGAVGFRGAAK